MLFFYCVVLGVFLDIIRRFFLEMAPCRKMEMSSIGKGLFFFVVESAAVGGGSWT